MQYKVPVKCDHSSEGYWTVPSCGTVYLSNKPDLLWVYRRDNPRGMLGEHEKGF